MIIYLHRLVIRMYCTVKSLVVEKLGKGCRRQLPSYCQALHVPCAIASATCSVMATFIVQSYKYLQSTLVVEKAEKLENNIQIVQCACKHHWIANKEKSKSLTPSS